MSNESAKILEEDETIVATDVKSHALSLDSALQDIWTGLSLWRVWSLLSIQDIRARYRRSKFGQLWMTVSMGITIVALGTVYSVLFRQDPATYLPYLAIGQIVWAFLASLIIDSSTAFTTSAGYLQNSSLPKSIYILRLIGRNLIIFGHNAILIPFVLLYAGIPIGWQTLLLIPNLALIVAFGFFAGLGIAIVCTRFRDLPQIITNVMQVAFFISPVIWRPEQLSGPVSAVVAWNPFSYLLDLLRSPLFSKVPTFETYAVVILLICTCMAITLPLFSRFRVRIVFWL
jgi:lipopolysaccharide transport system permease protein